jgi:hypothetical protein
MLVSSGSDAVTRLNQTTAEAIPAPALILADRSGDDAACGLASDFASATALAAGLDAVAPADRSRLSTSVAFISMVA